MKFVTFATLDIPGYCLQYIINAHHLFKTQNLCFSNEIVLERTISSSADNFAQDINELTVGYVVCRVHYFHLGSQHQTWDRMMEDDFSLRPQKCWNKIPGCLHASFVCPADFSLFFANGEPTDFDHKHVRLCEPLYTQIKNSHGKIHDIAKCRHISY